jgi:hypothetical protein
LFDSLVQRVRELQEALSAGTISLEIRRRNARIAALPKRWDRLRAGLDLILDQRGADVIDIPGGASGLLVRDYEVKDADRLVTRIAPAWSRWSPNCAATSASRTRSWTRWRRGLVMEKPRGADAQVDQMSQALNLLRGMVSLRKYSPLPRPPGGGRGWMA